MLTLDVSREQRAVNKRFFRQWCTVAIKALIEDSNTILCRRVCKLADGVDPEDPVVRIATLSVECSEDILDSLILAELEARARESPLVSVHSPHSPQSTHSAHSKQSPYKKRSKRLVKSSS